MSALRAILEDFEGGAAPEEGETVHVQQMKAAAYAEGYAAGEAAAIARRDADDEFLQHAMRSLDKAFDAMSANMQAEFCEALRSVVEKVFPSLAEAGFADAAAAAVLEAAHFGDGAGIVVKAAPNRTAALERAFAAYGAERAASVEADPKLGDLAATAEWRDAGVEVDFEAAIQQALAALETTVQQLKNGA